ncbi:hypothetical protein FHS82_001086 [Pseudochelatococcus lubricantis]|uniref:Uncharacterized protein n=1 Tax=Pseudochelatococcus lubricantis TaxID=1538102 RepID=A0ABX0UZ81_9HYPH|nr:hypothetical protein [Pseudochelatococcus lubricantis]NIJ57260.1 hypothetical protein [Pseudochelatococcus lubricantis]
MFILIPILLATLNRARGDDTWLTRLGLPGRALWYCGPLVGLVALLVQPWPVAVAWALAYLVWAVPAWGHLFGLGRYAPDREVDALSAALIEIAAGHVHVAFFLRHLLVVPGLALVSLASGSWWPVGAAIPAAALFVLAYEGAWRWAPRQPILVAELIVGALWGILILAA